MKANPTTPEAGELSELALRCEGAVPAEEWELIREAGKLVFPDLNREDHTNARFHINQLCDSGGFIDAAMTLVPEGWFTSDFHQGPSGGNWWKLSTIGAEDERYRDVAGKGQLPATALCAAALRAQRIRPKSGATPSQQGGA
jgi:hypothetical protein